MSAEMILIVAHLVIIGVTLAVTGVKVPGIIRRLSSEQATQHDWSRVFRCTQEKVA